MSGEQEYKASLAASTMRKWRTITRCPTHGIQSSVTVTFGLQRPREVVLTPPVCPKCEHLEAPQANIVSIEPVTQE